MFCLFWLKLHIFKVKSILALLLEGPNTILRIENESPVDLNPQLYGHEARTLLLCYNHCTSEGSQLGAFHLNIGKFCFLVYFSTILFFGEANPRNFVGSNLIELNYNLDFFAMRGRCFQPKLLFCLFCSSHQRSLDTLLNSF